MLICRVGGRQLAINETYESHRDLVMVVINSEVFPAYPVNMTISHEGSLQYFELTRQEILYAPRPDMEEILAILKKSEKIRQLLRY